MPQIAISPTLHEEIILQAQDRNIMVVPGTLAYTGNYDVSVSFAFYNWLTSEMVPGETFTQAITRLLGARGKGMRVAR